MKPITQVLDKWIEQGAEYNDTNVYSHSDTHILNQDYWLELNNGREWVNNDEPRWVTEKDILYGDSNLWEVMYPWALNIRSIVEDCDPRQSPIASGIKQYKSHQMMSLLQEDPRKYILDTSPLFK
jgi:hypothetical protein